METPEIPLNSDHDLLIKLSENVRSVHESFLEKVTDIKTDLGEINVFTKTEIKSLTERLDDMERTLEDVRLTDLRRQHDTDHLYLEDWRRSWKILAVVAGFGLPFIGYIIGRGFDILKFVGF